MDCIGGLGILSVDNKKRGEALSLALTAGRTDLLQPGHFRPAFGAKLAVLCNANRLVFY
jgi:hypothetical protein